MKIRVCTSACKIPNFVSWQIMRRTKYEASHVFLVYKDEVYEAADLGVAKKSLEEFRKNYRIIEDIELDVACTEQQFYDWFKSLMGIRYSTFQWWGFVMPKWSHRFFANERKGAICSEFVCWFLNDFVEAGIQDYEFRRPQEVIELVRAMKVAKNI